MKTSFVNQIVRESGLVEAVVQLLEMKAMRRLDASGKVTKTNQLNCSHASV